MADRNEPIEQDVTGEERLRLESRGHEKPTSYSTPDNTLNGWHSALWYFLDRDTHENNLPVDDLTPF